MAEIRPNSDAAAGYARIDALLSDHAQDTGEPFTMEEICLEVHEDGTYLGGLYAKIGRQWIFVELLALSPAARGKGLGRRLIAEIETRAVSMGKIGIWLDTYSFQAPGFYEKLGYTECGRIPDYPIGHDRRFFAKRLDGATIER